MGSGDGLAPASGRLWGSWDRYGRWRSSRWRMMVRSYPCVVTGSYRVVAAHFRYGPQVGLGIKPDDFLVYPLEDETHQRWHNGGQPPFTAQATWVADVWRKACRCGIVRAVSPGAFAAIEALLGCYEGAADYDAAVMLLREAMRRDELLIGAPHRQAQV